jgi:RNA polymerase sigma factor (sigma-70 family)
MAHPSLDKVMRHVRNLAAGQNASDQTDGELLRAFSAGDDQAAFAALAKRHGPLVLAVCRRVLGQLQDAEDAFQATFVVLARNAARLVQKGSLSSWLHGVAYRIALNARRLSARRRWHERQAKSMVPTNPAWEAGWREVQLLLDEEVQRLPEKYREPFILCCLESQSCAAAARRMGLKEGTVWSRLAEARKRLQKRLSRRGVELTAVLGAAALTGNPATAAALVAKAVSAATAPALPASGAVAVLVKGMARCLLLKKVKVGVVMFLAVSAMVGVTGMGAYQASLPERAAFQKKNTGPPPVAKDQGTLPAKKDLPIATDQYGDPLPRGAVSRIGSLQLFHGSQFSALVYSPDGKTLAACAYDSVIRQWDTATRKEVRQFQGQQQGVRSLAISPDGKLLAAAGFGEVKIWRLDLASNREFALAGTGAGADALAFSRDGKHLAVATKDHGICIWEVG